MLGGVQGVEVARELEAVGPVRVRASGDQPRGRDRRKVLEVALPRHSGRGELVCQGRRRYCVGHRSARAVRVSAGERRGAVELIVVRDAEVATGDVGHVVRLTRMSDAEVARGQPVGLCQGVELRGNRVADDRRVAGVLHHDLDDVLVAGDGGAGGARRADPRRHRPGGRREGHGCRGKPVQPHLPAFRLAQRSPTALRGRVSTRVTASSPRRL